MRPENQTCTSVSLCTEGELLTSLWTNPCQTVRCQNCQNTWCISHLCYFLFIFMCFRMNLFSRKLLKHLKLEVCFLYGLNCVQRTNLTEEPRKLLLEHRRYHLVEPKSSRSSCHFLKRLSLTAGFLFLFR